MKWNLTSLIPTFVLPTMQREDWQQCVFCHQGARATVCEHCLNVVDTFDTGEHGSGFINNRPDIQKLLPGLKEHPILGFGPHTTLLMDLINQFKYGKKFILAPILAELISNKINTCYRNIALPEAIVPVPIHPLKRMVRGFNQTELIGKEMSIPGDIIVLNNVIQRYKYLNPQAGKTGKQRRKLTASAFRVTDCKRLASLSHIALLDDVITTGTTMKQIIRMIEKVNPDIRIDLWSVSVSLPHE